jgi:hypothetical protein
MAIQDFKNIEKINQELESTAQIIKPADLNIFKTSAKNVADFGLSKNDAIEFRLYDISNNLLEQTNGVKVRYIHKDELPKYLRDSLDTKTGEKIFEIDVEKLVFEAGYGNGEFRVGFAFVKNYVGNENQKKKVWIHEVSPSRTEIRVLPLLGSDRSINVDLEDRYYSFMDNVSEFRQSYKKIQAFLDKIELNISTLIDDYFISTFGPKYIEVINKDFVFGGSEGYTNFKNKIYGDFRKSVFNEIDGKQFKLGASDFGQPIKNPMDLDDFVSTAEFRLIIENRLQDSIEYNMQFIRKREYQLSIRMANGQYQPSATLQSLLDTGYNSVTKIQTQPSISGLGGNTSNKTITPKEPTKETKTETKTEPTKETTKPTTEPTTQGPYVSGYRNYLITNLTDTTIVVRFQIYGGEGKQVQIQGGGDLSVCAKLDSVNVDYTDIGKINIKRGGDCTPDSQTGGSSKTTISTGNTGIIDTNPTDKGGGTGAGSRGSQLKPSDMETQPSDFL